MCLFSRSYNRRMGDNIGVEKTVLHVRRCICEMLITNFKSAMHIVTYTFALYVRYINSDI